MFCIQRSTHNETKKHSLHFQASISYLARSLYFEYTAKLFSKLLPYHMSVDFFFILQKATLSISVKLFLLVTRVNNYCQYMDINKVIHLLLCAGKFSYLRLVGCKDVFYGQAWLLMYTFTVVYMK